MKVLYHLGLGDAIATAAIIAKLAQENDTVEIPCWEHNLVSVQSFYVNHPNVIVRQFKHESDVITWGYDAALRLGHYDVNTQGIIWAYENIDFVQRFYRQAGLNIKEKDKYCPIKKACDLTRPYTYGALINGDHVEVGNGLFIYHEDASRGFIIPNKKGIPNVDLLNIHHHPENRNSILCLYKLIENAFEIHCIDSSVLHLVECLPTNAKLFYHKYARPHSTDYKYLTKNWEVI